MSRKDKLYADFVEPANGPIVEYLVIAVRLPNGAIELITNTYNLTEKLDYYMNAYDDDLFLKANPEIRIVNWMVV